MRWAYPPTGTSGIGRQVWCLPISQVPFLYGLFDWQLVSTERRLQLKRACKEQARLTVLAYREMQWRYRIMRKALFTFLINSINSYTLLQRYTDVLPGIADTECTHRIVALIKSGRSLYRDAIEHARKMVRDQGELPIIDMFRVDSENTVIDTFSMPLLPIVPQEDSEYFFTLIGQLTVWRQELEAFWGEQGG